MKLWDFLVVFTLICWIKIVHVSIIYVVIMFFQTLQIIPRFIDN